MRRGAPSRIGRLRGLASAVWLRPQECLENKTVQHAQAYPTTHNRPTMSTNVTSDARDGWTFGNSEATFAPKNWASKRTWNRLGATSARCESSGDCPSGPDLGGWWLRDPRPDARGGPDGQSPECPDDAPQSSRDRTTPGRDRQPVRVVAAAFGISQRTARKWRARYPAAAPAWGIARAGRIDRPARRRQPWSPRSPPCGGRGGPPPALRRPWP